jgi:hypothetical protein
MGGPPRDHGLLQTRAAFRAYGIGVAARGEIGIGKFIGVRSRPDGGIQDFFSQGLEEPLQSPLAQTRGFRLGMHPRLKKNFVRLDISDACQESLIHEGGFDGSP